jgi:hypothetical protein
MTFTTQSNFSLVAAQSMCLYLYRQLVLYPNSYQTFLPNFELSDQYSAVFSNSNVSNWHQDVGFKTSPNKVIVQSLKELKRIKRTQICRSKDRDNFHRHNFFVSRHPLCEPIQQAHLNSKHIRAVYGVCLRFTSTLTD